jgi:hypothetical protein
VRRKHLRPEPAQRRAGRCARAGCRRGPWAGAAPGGSCPSQCPRPPRARPRGRSRGGPGAGPACRTCASRAARPARARPRPRPRRRRRRRGRAAAARRRDSSSSAWPSSARRARCAPTGGSRSRRASRASRAAAAPRGQRRAAWGAGGCGGPYRVPLCTGCALRDRRPHAWRRRQPITVVRVSHAFRAQWPPPATALIPPPSRREFALQRGILPGVARWFLGKTLRAAAPPVRGSRRRLARPRTVPPPSDAVQLGGRWFLHSLAVTGRFAQPTVPS